MADRVPLASAITFVFRGAKAQSSRVSIGSGLVAGGRTRRPIVGRVLFVDTDCRLPGAVRLSIAGNRFSVDPRKSFTLGSSLARDDISVDTALLSHLLQRPMLQERHATLLRDGEKIRLTAKANAGIVVLRPGSEAGFFAAHCLSFDASILLPQAEGLVPLTTLSGPVKGAYSIDRRFIPQGNIHFIPPGGADLTLESNDIILLPLGTGKNKEGMIWLPVVIDEVMIEDKTPQTVPQRPPLPAGTLQFSGIPTPEQVMEELEAKALAEVEASLKGNSSYLALVPQRYKATVISMAEKAFKEKGQGRTFDDFQSLMAKSWLIKMRLFTLYASRFGYAMIMDEATEITPGANCEIIGLTARASIVTAGCPGIDGKRPVRYLRVAARESSGIPPALTTTINPVRLRQRFRFRNPKHEVESDAAYHATSPLILLAILTTSTPQEGDRQESAAFDHLSRSFARIEQHTMHGRVVALEEPMQEPLEKEPKKD